MFTPLALMGLLDLCRTGFGTFVMPSAKAENIVLSHVTLGLGPKIRLHPMSY